MFFFADVLGTAPPSIDAVAKCTRNMASFQFTSALCDAESAARCSLATEPQSVAHLRAGNTLPKFLRIQNYSTTSPRKQRLEYEATLPSRAPTKRASSAKKKKKTQLECERLRRRLRVVYQQQTKESPGTYELHKNICCCW